MQRDNTAHVPDAPANESRESPLNRLLRKPDLGMADLAADAAKDVSDRFAAEPRVGPVDLLAHAARSRKDEELTRGPGREHLRAAPSRVRPERPAWGLAGEPLEA